MSLAEFLRPSSARLQPSRARRRRPAARPGLEDLECRLVLSQTAIALPPIHAAAMVHTSASANTNISLPTTVTGVNITSLIPNGARGALAIAGTATGTILGKNFTAPLTGLITPARNAHGTPILDLTIQPINLSLLGLNVNTSTIHVNISAQRNGVLGGLLTNTLNQALNLSSAGSTAPAIAALNANLNQAQGLGTLGQALSSARVNLASFQAGTANTSTILSLTAGPVNLNLLGLHVRVDNGHNGPVRVNISATRGAGLLGDLLSGITGTGGRRALLSQVSGALSQINTTTLNLPTIPLPGPGSAGSNASAPNILTLDLKPLDVNLLGLEVKTSEIIVTVSAQPGSGALLGNLLTTVANLVNLQGVNNALNNVLANVVNLANASTLSVAGVNPAGALGTASLATTPVLTAHIAPVDLNLLGAVVHTSPIDVSITAHSGPGLVLGNVITDLANLLNTPPPNGQLSVDYLNTQIQNLLNQLNVQIPGIPAAPTTTPAATTGTTNILHLTVPPINLNLLGLVLSTDQIQVNADAQTGNGQLLGNLLSDLLNTLNATPASLNTLNNEVNGLLAKVVGVLNATSLTLPTGAVGTLNQTLQTLALPNLVTATPGATAPVLNLSIASTTPGAPPVNVDLLGLIITTSNIHAQLNAVTGNGQILGNLVYNISHLLDPGGSVGLLTILSSLGL